MDFQDVFDRDEARWPDGAPGDGGPWHPQDGLWYPERNHVPFNPPDYYDWLDHDPFDFRDRNWDSRQIDPLTGLPPKHLQGHEYVPGEWRRTNGAERPGNTLRWNIPLPPHPHGKKRRLAWVWPSDGKRKHTWGRWKDVASGEGPDIFVTRHGNRPSRNQWRNKFLDFTPEDPGFNTHRDMPWAKRPEKEAYDFRERVYRKKKGPGDIFWTDATWPSRGADYYKRPLNFRCERGDWFNLSWAPFGGVVLDEYNGRPKNRGIFA